MSRAFAFGVAIIGTGWGLSAHLPAIANKSHLKCTSIWARSSSKLQAIRDSSPSLPSACQLTDDFQDLLKREDVHIVDITTPPRTHKDMAIQALRAGKHVICEKPFAMNVSEALEMVQEARKHPELLSIVDHELRLLPAVKKMKQLVTQEKWCGDRIFHIEMKIQRGRQSPGMTWSWWNDQSAGGGMLGAVGSHMIDFLQFVTEKKVVRVQATLKTFLKERVGGEATSDDFAQLNLELEDGSFATISTSAVKYSADKKFGGRGGLIVEISGSQGGLVFETHKLYGKRIGDEQNTVFFDEELPNIWISGTQELFKQIEGKLSGSDPQALQDMATFEDGLNVQRILDAVHLSNRTGQWVDVVDTEKVTLSSKI